MRGFCAIVWIANIVAVAVQAGVTNSSSPYAAWSNGLPTDASFFPIAVWLQNPVNAARYKAAGINLYVGLWRGPTAEQLAQLEKAGMHVICGQRRGLQFKDNRTIVGWMHNDEPDNAQSRGEGMGYGPPVPAETIIRDYQHMRAADPSRPVLLNLGQGVAWDNWIGRGVRRNHPEDYPDYVKGCDIVSFDIYPVVHDSPEVAGKLEFVARGVERLVGWTRREKVIWNCIECSRISNAKVKPTVEQIRSEVWMSLIHGSRGLIYFVHQFQPTFREASLLDDPELLAGVTAINRQIHDLAPVLNSPTITNAVTMEQAPGLIASTTRRHDQHLYLFAVNMRPESARGGFRLHETGSAFEAEVIGESRKIGIKNGLFTDDFAAYAPHLYRIRKGRR